MGSQGLPRIPDCAKQFTRDPVTEGRAQKHSQRCSSVQRGSALSRLANGALVELRPDLLRPGRQDFVKKACVESAGRYRVHIYAEIANFFSQRLGEADDARL